MNIVYFLLPIALLLGLSFLGAFIYSSYRGQFDDLETPAHRLLIDDEVIAEIGFNETIRQDDLTLRKDQ